MATPLRYRCFQFLPESSIARLTDDPLADIVE
jgi:hypothetical protein